MDLTSVSVVWMTATVHLMVTSLLFPSIHARSGRLVYWSTPRVSDFSRSASTILSVVNVVNAICMRRMTSLSRLLDKILKNGLYRNIVGSNCLANPVMKERNELQNVIFYAFLWELSLHAGCTSCSWHDPLWLFVLSVWDKHINQLIFIKKNYC